MFELVLAVSAICLFRYLIEQSHYNRFFTLVTGVIGVPVHEIGHYLMAKLVGFKVIKVKLFRMPTHDNPVLGYVEYQYPLTISGSIRKVVVSIGPIFTGVVTLYWFGEKVTPYLITPASNSLDIAKFVAHAGIEQWIYLWALSSITLHMLPSSTDIKIAISGSIWVGIATYAGLVFAATHTLYLVQQIENVLALLSKLLLVGVILSAPLTFLAIIPNIFSIIKSSVYIRYKETQKRTRS